MVEEAIDRRKWGRFIGKSRPCRNMEKMLKKKTTPFHLNIVDMPLILHIPSQLPYDQIFLFWAYCVNDPGKKLGIIGNNA